MIVVRTVLLFLCRYVFRNSKQVGLQELGPRFTQLYASCKNPHSTLNTESTSDKVGVVLHDL